MIAVSSSGDVGIDYFDFAVVNADLQTLQGAYEEFYKAMQRIDVKINTMLNIPDNEALYGVKGKNFLDTWNNKCAGFKNYYFLFKEWSNKVIDVSNVYSNFEQKVLGAAAEKVVFDKIEEKIESESAINARLVTALLLGVDEIDGVVINNKAEGGQEYAQLLGDSTFLIKRDEEGTIISITSEDGSVITPGDSRIVEERIDEQYRAYKNGELDEAAWGEFVSSLTDEEVLYITYLETGAVLYNNDDIASVLADYVSPSLNFTGAGNIYAYKNDVVISKDGVPYVFMGLSNIDSGGYIIDEFYPVFKAYNSEDAFPNDPLHRQRAYTYENGEFVELPGFLDGYKDRIFESSAISFEDGTGPARVIPSGEEKSPSAPTTIHHFGVPAVDDPRIVVADSTDFFKTWNTSNWSDLPKILYVPDGKYIHDNCGWIFSNNDVKPADGKGFYMIRDDESESYWLLHEDGVYLEFGSNSERLIGSSIDNGWVTIEDIK